MKCNTLERDSHALESRICIRWVAESEEHPRQDRDNVLPVVQMHHLYRQRVEGVPPRLTTHTREAVHDETRRNARTAASGQVEVQEATSMSATLHLYRFEYLGQSMPLLEKSGTDPFCKGWGGRGPTEGVVRYRHRRCRRAA